MQPDEKPATAGHAADQAASGGPPTAGSEEKLATEVWQQRTVFEMNVYLLRNTGLDLQRWFEREIQALKNRPLRGGQTC